MDRVRAPEETRFSHVRTPESKPERKLHIPKWTADKTILSETEPGINISFYISILTFIKENFINMTPLNQISYLDKFIEKLNKDLIKKNDFIYNLCKIQTNTPTNPNIIKSLLTNLSTYNVFLKNKGTTINFPNGADEPDDIINIISDYFSVNIIILDNNKDNIFIYNTFDKFKKNLLLLHYDNIYEPLIYLNTHNNTLKDNKNTYNIQLLEYGELIETIIGGMFDINFTPLETLICFKNKILNNNINNINTKIQGDARLLQPQKLSLIIEDNLSKSDDKQNHNNLGDTNICPMDNLEIKKSDDTLKDSGELLVKNNNIDNLGDTLIKFNDIVTDDNDNDIGINNYSINDTIDEDDFEIKQKFLLCSSKSIDGVCIDINKINIKMKKEELNNIALSLNIQTFYVSPNNKQKLKTKIELINEIKKVLSN